jgi:hypothetical protein
MKNLVEIDLEKYDLVPVKEPKKEPRTLLSVEFQERNKYLIFRRYCKLNNINMSSLIRNWINEKMDNELKKNK